MFRYCLASLTFGLIILTSTPAFAFNAFYGQSTFGSSQQCPFNSGFRMVVVREPDVNNISDQTLLECRNVHGAVYYSALGDARVDDTDPAWVAVPYPKAWVCVGNEPEQCKFSF